MKPNPAAPLSSARADTSSAAGRVRARLDGREWARVHVFILVLVSAAAAFLCSVAMLALQVHSMAWRYAVAALAGYGCFLVLVRSWVAWKRRAFVPDDGVDLTDLPGPGDLFGGRHASVDAARSAFDGGRSGGAGGGASWQPGTTSPTATTTSGGKSGGGVSFDLDGDDLFWLIVALAAALAALVAVGYVIWIAPTLLTEAAVNAAVAGRVYHGLRKRDGYHWTNGLVRRTALPAAVVVASVALAGYALHRAAPEARSIGGVWHHVRR